MKIMKWPKHKTQLRECKGKKKDLGEHYSDLSQDDLTFSNVKVAFLLFPITNLVGAIKRELNYLWPNKF